MALPFPQSCLSICGCVLSIKLLLRGWLSWPLQSFSCFYLPLCQVLSYGLRTWYCGWQTMKFGKICAVGPEKHNGAVAFNQAVTVQGHLEDVLLLWDVGVSHSWNLGALLRFSSYHWYLRTRLQCFSSGLCHCHVPNNNEVCLFLVLQKTAAESVF